MLYLKKIFLGPPNCRYVNRAVRVKVRLFPSSSACSEQLICTAALVSAVCGKKSAASVCCYLVSELRIFQILYTVDIGIESSR